jgi:RHS repeat-associated protein
VFKAVVVATTDYYAFGMAMLDRQTNAGSYRFGYNGMEIDKEMSGNGNSYTTEFRQYDPRLGRWKSLDPLMAKYPMMSPYVAFNNNPVYFVDPLGLEGNGPGGPGGNPNATPAEPIVGYKCYDEETSTILEYKGNGQWNDYTSGDLYQDELEIDIYADAYYEKQDGYYGRIEEVVIIAKKRTGNENPQGTINNDLNKNHQLKISYGANASKNIMSQHSVNLLGSIALNSGVEKLHINSTVRSPYDQAYQMYINLENDGIQYGYNTYGTNGDKVIKVYADSKLKKLNKDQIIQLMYNKIMELGPSNVSNHCADWSKLNTIDISINSVPKEFINECKKMGIKVLYEPKYGCWHLEIKQPKI